VFFSAQADLAEPRRFLRHLAPLRNKRWVVYAKAPFAGPGAVLAYLSLCTHRVAISNDRLIAFDKASVTFRYKDYRRSGPQRQQVMTLDAHEFMRRFLLHVLRTASTASGIADCSRARHARPTSPASANCWPYRRRRKNPMRPKSRPLNSRPVLAAAGACASSRPSNAGCSRARRPQQPGRRCDPARFIPTPCRRHVAPANDTSRAHRRAAVVTCADPCRHRRKRLPALPDLGRDRQEMLFRCASNQAQSASRPSTRAQPKHQIAISRALHTAGSFLGDFPTPEGVRNSSRKQTDGFG
jgi:hypothetical protein